MARSFFLFAAFAFLTAAGCVRHVEEPDSDFGRLNSATTFKKLPNAKLRLECISPDWTFHAGDMAILTYRLSNVGKEPVSINEWWEADAFNVRLLHAPFVKDILPKEGDWTKVESAPPANASRSPLLLRPGNSVMIDVEVPFVLATDPKTLERSFQRWVRVELALNSVSARSMAIPVSVTPP